MSVLQTRSELSNPFLRIPPDRSATAIAWAQGKQEDISVIRQCELLGLARSTLYCTAKGMSEKNLKLMRLLTLGMLLGSVLRRDGLPAGAERLVECAERRAAKYHLPREKAFRPILERVLYDVRR